MARLLLLALVLVTLSVFTQGAHDHIQAANANKGFIHPRIDNKMKKLSTEARDFVGTVTEKAQQAYNETTEELEDSARELRKSAVRKYRELRVEVAENYEEIKERVETRMVELREDVRDVYEEVKEKVVDVYDETKEKVKSKFKEYWAYVKSDFKKVYRASMNWIMNKAIDSASEEGGFLYDADIRIRFPEALKKAKWVALKLGMDKLLLQIVVEMNIAAAKTIRYAAPALLKAVASLKIHEARALVETEGAFTAYLRAEAHEEIMNDLIPSIEKGLEDTKAHKWISRLVRLRNWIPFIKKSDFSLSKHVAEQTTKGLWHLVSKFEAFLRDDPVGKVADEISKVLLYTKNQILLKVGSSVEKIQEWNDDLMETKLVKDIMDAIRRDDDDEEKEEDQSHEVVSTETDPSEEFFTAREEFDIDEMDSYGDLNGDDEEVSTTRSERRATRRAERDARRERRKSGKPGGRGF